ncbi:MAG: hypothetical protein ABI665_28905 [Vicinamibacterales bacterium]
MRRSVVIALLCGLVSSSALATTMVPLSFTELVKASATVVYARVADVRGQWTADRQGIESLVTLEVLTPFKGAPGERVTFTVAGGQAGRYINLLPGAPTFTEGDLVVVFLTARGPRLPIATGFTQGVYRVSRDVSSGAMTVAPPRDDPQRRALTLAEFQGRVRAAQEGAK